MKSCLACSALLLAILLFAAISVKAGNPAGAASKARKAVDTVNAKETESCAKMDHAASLTLWADDGVDLIQGMPPLVGKAAIAKWYASLAPQLGGAKMEYCTIDWRAIQIQGDIAYEWGINRQKIDFPPPRKAGQSTGKILFILKRQRGGAWKIELESWSSSPAS